MDFKNQEQLRPEIKDTVLAHSRQLAEILGDGLRSIVVYGSALGQNFVPGKSNINILLILKQIDVSLMKKCLKLVGNGERKRIVAPLMLTQQHINSSLDVFPIEFSEIRDNHLTIYGDELLNDLPITKQHLRLQCEREIKGKLIHLRQGFLESSLRGNSLKLLLEDSMRAVLPMMRAALRMRDKTPPIAGVDVIGDLCREFPLDENTFINIFRLKEQKKSPPQEDLENLLANYLIQLQKLAQIIDQMEVN